MSSSNDNFTFLANVDFETNAEPEVEPEPETQPEFKSEPQSEPIFLCKCLTDENSTEQIEISPRKQHILSTVTRTEEYFRERRIPELIRFLLTKIIAEGSSHPVAFLEKLLNDCMLFRAGHGRAPVIYEDRHLHAVIKSFDPGNRGWLQAGQIRRAFTTLGLTLKRDLEDRLPSDVVLNMLQKTQENELYNLLAAGHGMDDDLSSFEGETNATTPQ